MCAYCDEDWASNMDDRKSKSCYVFLLGNSKKQTSIVMSITKAKYMVAPQTTRQAMCFSLLFGNIGVPQMKPIVIYDNNQCCISLSKNPIFHVCTKHIKIHHHLV